jgi:NADH-quinone oxidoreductase subunit I
MAKGLIKGLGITIKRFFQPKVTVQYPDERLPLPDRFLGKPEFFYDKCIACNQCVLACPNKVIKLETETVDKKKVVTRYDFDQQYCLFCGLCQEACPKDAIKFTKDFELTQYHRSNIKIPFVKPEQIEKKKEEIKKAAAEKAAAEAAKAKEAENTVNKDKGAN